MCGNLAVWFPAGFFLLGVQLRLLFIYVSFVILAVLNAGVLGVLSLLVVSRVTAMSGREDVVDVVDSKCRWHDSAWPNPAVSLSCLMNPALNEHESTHFNATHCFKENLVRHAVRWFSYAKQRWHWPVVDDVLKSTASSNIFQYFPGWMTKGYFVVFLVVTASDSPHNIPPGSTWRKIGGLNESEWLFEDVWVLFWGISFLKLSWDLSYPAHLFLTLSTRVYPRAAAAVRDQNFTTQVVTGVFVDNAFRCAEKQRSLVTWCS